MSDALPPLADAPAAVRAEMASLCAMLDASVPRKRALQPELLVATWNVKDFGSLTEKWTSSGRDSPKRDWRALWAIAEVISRFDIVALQEVTGDLRALRTLMKTLGPRWGFLMTDVTRGSAGGGERMAFVYDGARVAPSGLAGELVVPEEWTREIGPGALTRQFARTPYAVSFGSVGGGITLILVALHVLYGGSATERVPELQAIARWMADWAGEVNRWHHNLVALGDFNIDRQGDPLWEAMTSTGLTVPPALHDLPRSIFAVDATKREKYYDQIAWFESGSSRRVLDLRAVAAGSVDFVPHLYRDIELPKRQLQYRVSDHYPLWVAFEP